MNRAARLAPVLMMLALLGSSPPWLTVSGTAVAQEYRPFIGQRGKDVIWVPTPENLIEAMLDAAGVTPGDYVIDLGSGDGRIVVAAARRGARALGIEYNPDLTELSRRNAEAAGVADRARFVTADIFSSDLTRATVVTLYLLPDLNLRLRPTLLGLAPGTRVVSHAFHMGEWAPDETILLADREAYLWIVPARADGAWTLRDGDTPSELRIVQNFQKIEGTLRPGLPIEGGRVLGDRVSFRAGDASYEGRIAGDAMEGTVTTGGVRRTWSAARAGR
ncbi:MAG: methyltransferase domain-containing protein [Acidobacteria bacterium]|nr:methyltransferase domain-containing protein [Acidobacteriota bacterium]